MVEHKWIEVSLKAFAKVMKKHKIPFWLEYGTQLGAVREGRIIPHDNDGDIGVMLSSVEKMKGLKDDFEVERIMMAYQPNHIFINYKINDREWLATVDVYTFTVKEHKGKKWLVRIENGKEFDVRSPFKYYEKLKTIYFLGEIFFIPWMAIEALEFVYGEEWKTAIKKPSIQIMFGKPTDKQLNQMGRTHHKKLEDL